MVHKVVDHKVVYRSVPDKSACAIAVLSMRDGGHVWCN